MSKDLRGALFASALVSIFLMASYALAAYSASLAYDEPWKWFGAVSAMAFLAAGASAVMVLTAIERMLKLD